MLTYTVSGELVYFENNAPVGTDSYLVGQETILKAANWHQEQVKDLSVWGSNRSYKASYIDKLENQFYKINSEAMAALARGELKPKLTGKYDEADAAYVAELDIRYKELREEQSREFRREHEAEQAAMVTEQAEQFAKELEAAEKVAEMVVEDVKPFVVEKPAEGVISLMAANIEKARPYVCTELDSKPV